MTAWSGFSISVQLASPRWIVGRTVSIYFAMTYGGIAARSWLWATVTEVHSLAAALIASAGALVLVAATGLFLPIRDSVAADHDALGNVDQPEVAVDLRPNSGPIAVRIAYRIKAADTELFLDLMQDRRRAQSRIGARHWIVERDLHDAERWTESFRTPTWTDYLRFNHRHSAADNDLEQRLHSLHAEAGSPRLSLAIERPAGRPRKPDLVTPFTPRI